MLRSFLFAIATFFITGCSSFYVYELNEDDLTKLNLDEFFVAHNFERDDNLEFSSSKNTRGKVPIARWEKVYKGKIFPSAGSIDIRCFRKDDIIYIELNSLRSRGQELDIVADNLKSWFSKKHPETTVIYNHSFYLDFR